MAPGNRWAARTGLLATLLLALQLARGVVAQSATYPPIAVYDDSDGSDGRDVSRKAALTTSVQVRGATGPGMRAGLLVCRGEVWRATGGRSAAWRPRGEEERMTEGVGCREWGWLGPCVQGGWGM